MLSVCDCEGVARVGGIHRRVPRDVRARGVFCRARGSISGLRILRYQHRSRRFLQGAQVLRSYAHLLSRRVLCACQLPLAQGLNFACCLGKAHMCWTELVSHQTKSRDPLYSSIALVVWSVEGRAKGDGPRQPGPTASAQPEKACVSPGHPKYSSSAANSQIS